MELSNIIVAIEAAIQAERAQISNKEIETAVYTPGLKKALQIIQLNKTVCYEYELRPDHWVEITKKDNLKYLTLHGFNIRRKKE